MPEVTILQPPKPDPADVTPVDPDRTPHHAADPEWVVLSHGFGVGFARGDTLCRADIPGTTDQHLETLIANGALAPVGKVLQPARSPNSGKPSK